MQFHISESLVLYFSCSRVLHNCWTSGQILDLEIPYPKFTLNYCIPTPHTATLPIRYFNLLLSWNRCDEKSACIAICERMGLKGYQVFNLECVTVLLCMKLQHPLNWHRAWREWTYHYVLQIGKTKVFLRAGQMAELDARRTEVLAHAARLIQRQIRTYLTRKEFIILRKATIHLQKHWRGKIIFWKTIYKIIYQENSKSK